MRLYQQENSRKRILLGYEINGVTYVISRDAYFPAIITVDQLQSAKSLHGVCYDLFYALSRRI